MWRESFAGMRQGWVGTMLENNKRISYQLLIISYISKNDLLVKSFLFAVDFLQPLCPQQVAGALRRVLVGFEPLPGQVVLAELLVAAGQIIAGAGRPGTGRRHLHGPLAEP